MADVVLVHGTTQTAAGYWRLSDALAARGHRPLTVDVPSGGASTAVEYAELLAAQLPAGVRRPVVAAHSGAGVLLPALARRLDAAHQVWLAAAVVDHAGARSFRQEILDDPAAIFSPEWTGIDPTADPVLATYFLFHDADLGTLRAALPTVAACDLSTVFAETPAIDPAARPSTFVLPADDRAMRPSWLADVARDRLGVAPRVLPGGHNLHVAHAEAVADIIDRAARA